MRRGVWALLLLSGVAGAGQPPILYRNPVRTDAGEFILETTLPDPESRQKIAHARRTGRAHPSVEEILESSHPDPALLSELQLALASAGKSLATWGALKVPVHVVVVPTHADLEAAVHHPGFGWLRAWARYDDVTVQSPQTWSALEPEQHAINEVITHELTHCLLFQRIGGPEDWFQRRIPLWFREGMASYTAKQEYRWWPLERLAQFYAAHPGTDPVTDGESLYRDQSDAVYSAAHHAFAFLVRRYGEEAVKEILNELGAANVGFPEAFQAAVGLPLTAFVDDFERYVRLRGFRAAERH